jgi:signal transduction histidine kinase
MQLSPPVFHEKGLAGGLEWLGRQAYRNYGLTVFLDLDRTLEPDTEAVRMFLFEAVRELLLNAAKHAKVKEARVRMGPFSPSEMQITVEDSGVGFDPAKLESDASLAEGLGLFSIRERLNFLMGRLEISSSPGHGSTFTLVVPVHGLAETPPPPPPVGTIARRTEGGPRNADQYSHRG